MCIRDRNANNSNFEYVVAGFRLLPHVGMSFGIIPFTNVGYNYSASEWVLSLIHIYVHIYQLCGEIEIALQVAGVDNVDDDIRRMLDELLAHIEFCRRIRCV